MSFGPEYAPSEADCLSALDDLLARLPPGFIDRGRFAAAWMPMIRQGDAGTRRSDQALELLLPPATGWPQLEPVCDLTPRGPVETFLMTLNSAVFRQDRERGRRESAALLPILVCQTAGDRMTCPEHEAADGRAVRLDRDGLAPPFFDWRWACRCTELQMSERIARRRGHL